MKNDRILEQPADDEPTTLMKGKDFEPEEKSSPLKTDQPATAFNGPHDPPSRGGKQD